MVPVKSRFGSRWYTNTVDSSREDSSAAFSLKKSYLAEKVRYRFLDKMRVSNRFWSIYFFKYTPKGRCGGLVVSLDRPSLV